MKNKTIKSILVSVLLIWSFGVLAQPYAIGTKTVTFQDTERNNRSVQTVFYYPATQAGTDQPFVNGSFPLIVFGHGFMMNYDAYALYWQNLVPRGYILAFPRTEEGTGPNHGTFGEDLRFLNNFIKNESALNTSSFLYNHVGETSALMGHSMGGGASFLGASNNNNITALINFAAAETTPSAIAQAANVHVPTLQFMGTNDGVTPPATHQIPMYNALGASCKTLIKISGGGHCFFAESNTACSTGEIFTSPQPTITRAQQHSVIMAFLIPYLDFILKNDMTSKSVFQDSLISSNRITYEQKCTNNDLRMCQIVNPKSSCALQNENIVVKIQNSGGDVISPTSLSYSINGVVTTENITASLFPGAYLVHTFSTTEDLSAPGQYIIGASVNSTLDTILTNNTKTDTLINNSTFLPQSVNFTGFTGTNLSAISTGWQEAQGLVPSGTTSSWVSSQGLGGGSNITTKVNFYSSPIREWIVGPAFKVTANTMLYFDAAVCSYGNFNAYASGMGTNDKLYIKISTDCGTTWTNLDSIVKNTTLTNNLSNFSINLSAYSGQVIRIAFQAFRSASVSNDYDFHLDNILIKDMPPIDVAPLGLQQLLFNPCYTASDSLFINVTNYGIDTLFLNSDHMDILVEVNGPTGYQSTTRTISSGIIAPGQVQTFGVLNNFDLSLGGQYTIGIGLTLTTDVNPVNNSISLNVLNSTSVIEITGDTVICSGNSATLNAQIINFGTGPQASAANNTSYSIPDNNTNGVTSQITVSNASNLLAGQIISVKVNITHIFVSDLILKLTAPDNSFIILSNRRGGSSDHYTNVVFRMDAADSISTAPGPFSGPYIPEQAFGNLTGDANGIWRLNVADVLSTDAGTLQNWEITFNTDNGIVSYEWSTGDLTPQITANPTQTQTYQLSVTDMLNCVSVYNHNVQVLNNYTFSLGNDTAICQGQGVTFDGGSFNNVLWHNQSSQQYYTSTTSEQIIAQVSNNCGVFTDTVNVTVLALPTVNIGDTINVCTNTDLILDAGAGFASYVWSTQQTAQTITVSSGVETTQNYYVIVSDNNGCSNTDSVHVIFTICSYTGEMMQEYNIYVYPNPVADVFVIDVQDDITLNMGLYSLSGQLISTQTVSGKTQLKLAYLTAGTYFIIFEDGNNYKKTIKILKN